MATGSFRRRRLARELRRLREDRGLVGEVVAKAVDISPSTLSRIETATVEIMPKNVRLLLDYYGVHGDEREALLTLAREARRQGWWHAYGDVLPEWFEVYIDLEGEADTLSVYDAQFVNGLLQTADYARALLSAARPEDSPEEIDRRVELRMQRQARVLSGGLRLRSIVDEVVFHHAYGGPKAMRGQLDRLIEMSALRNVSLQVLPAASPAGVVGSFSILEFPDPSDPPVVYLEAEVGAYYVEKPEQVRHYARLFDRLQASALSPEASVTRLAQLLKE